MAEAEGQIIVALRVKERERMFEFRPRIGVFAGKPVRDAGCAMRDARFRRIGNCLDVTEEGRGVGAHRP
jgi:hypothetical protein